VTDRLTATVIGAGAGGTLSIDALIASDRFDLLAVADMSDAGRQRVTDKTNGTVATYASYQQMFAESPSDVICVSTWAPSHLEITTAALAVDGLRGLLVEKPLGDSVAAGAGILDIVRTAGLPLVVPHGLMAQAAALEVIDRVRGGAIGELRVVEMECTGWDLINAGIHWLQFFVSLVRPSPITTVLAAADTSTRTFRDGMQVETEAVTMARTADGVRVLLNTGDNVPISRSDTVCLMRIIGSRGFIEFGAFEPYYTIVSPGHDRVRVDVTPFAVSGHQRHLEYLADQIESGVRDYRVPEASLEALRIVEAGYESHRRHGSVSLPLGIGAGVAAGYGGDWDPGLAYSGSGGGRNGRDFS
jgi:predicted dehydrogenase